MPRSQPPYDMTARGGMSFAIQLPQRYLAKVSAASSRRVGEYTPVSRRGHEWQRDAFTYNELIGEVGYLHNLTANLVATCELRIMETVPDENGLPVLVESEDPRALRVMAAFTGPQGGQTELKRRAAMHYQIAGESYLLGTPLVDEFGINHGFSWEFLSTEEIRIENQGTKQAIKRNSTGISDSDAGFVDVEAYIARFWRPDPRYSARADSPMKRVLPICRELVVLGEVVDGVAKSRLSSGLLFVPEELSFGPLNESEEEGNDTDDIDRFVEALVDHMRAPVEDRTSAAGLVPLVVKGAAEFGKEIRLIPLAQDLDESYQTLRIELLRRLAQGLDAPPEVISGKAALNHWSSYNVDADFIDKHVDPIGNAVAEFISAAYLRPMLVEFEDVADSEVDKFHLVFDSRSITARHDEGPAATGAWDRLALSDSTYLRANGFDDDDQPSEDEKRNRMLEKIVLTDPTNFAASLLPILYPELGDVFDGAGIGRDDTRQVRAPESGGDGGVAPPSAAPTNPASGAGPAGASVQSLLDRLTVAADLALERALERAGNRVISKAAKHPVLRDQFKTVQRDRVLGTMSDLDFRTLDLSRQDLVGDAWDNFTLRGRSWVRDWLVGEGESTFVADEIANFAMRDVARHLDEWLAENVAREMTVGRNGLRVPTELVSEPLVDAMARYSRLL